MKKTTTTMTKLKIALRALALCGAVTAAGCGQTSYFEVSLAVKPDPGPSCISRGYTCTVSVSGADSGYFSLNETVCRMRTTANLGLFQFATEKESGTVNFKVDLYDGTLTLLLASGSGGNTIKPGARQTVAVDLIPNDAVLAQAGCK